MEYNSRQIFVEDVLLTFIEHEYVSISGTSPYYLQSEIPYE